MSKVGIECTARFIDELVGYLQSYELDLPKTSKSKSMALKSIDDVDISGFDDELFATEISYLAKNFRNFLRNNNRRARGKNTAETRNFRRNDPTKVNSTKKPKEKVGQPSNNSMGLQCFGCQGYDHIDRKSTRLNSSHERRSRMPSSA